MDTDPRDHVGIQGTLLSKKDRPVHFSHTPKPKNVFRPNPAYPKQLSRYRDRGGASAKHRYLDVQRPPFSPSAALQTPRASFQQQQTPPTDLSVAAPQSLEHRHIERRVFHSQQPSCLLPLPSHQQRDGPLSTVSIPYFHSWKNRKQTTGRASRPRLFLNCVESQLHPGEAVVL